jgi:hypothetical protein
VLQCTFAVAASAASPAAAAHSQPFGASRAFRAWLAAHPLYGPGNPNLAALGASERASGSLGAWGTSGERASGVSAPSGLPHRGLAACVLPLTRRGLGMEVGRTGAHFGATRIQARQRTTLDFLLPFFFLKLTHTRSLARVPFGAFFF